MAKGNNPEQTDGSNLNFEAKLRAAADKMRGHTDSFQAHLHRDLKADLAPVRKALSNCAWIQHLIHHLSPVGVGGFPLANGSMSTQASNEAEIRKPLIEAGLVDCMVGLLA